MKTQIITLDRKTPDKNDVEKAAQIIKKGELVAFPTETVYGLGANGLNKDASKKIYSVKGRPSNNPLIFHISDQKQIKDLVDDIPQSAKILMDAFWPGPLTLVFNKNKNLSSELTSNLETIAIRMPENIIARELISASATPIVAPSANLSGKPSPTTAQHVFDDLQGKIELIIDGGEVEIGLESTIVDVSSSQCKILRPGKISREELNKVIYLDENDDNTRNNKPKAPGMMYKHYSPDAQVVVVDKDENNGKIKEQFSQKSIILQYSTLEEMGKKIYADFRDADKQGFETIVVKSVDNSGLGEAIMNRVLKASSKQ